MAKAGWETDYSASGTVRVTLFWTDNYFGGVHRIMISTMRSILASHGLSLDLLPALGEPAAPFKIAAPTFADGLIHEENYGELRNNCASAFNDQSGKARLPVIFCQFKLSAQGITIPTGYKPSSGGNTLNWLPFCLVDASAHGSSVMLHESGHAAGLPHLTEAGAPYNFMADGPDGSIMYKAQLQKYVNAYFIV